MKLRLAIGVLLLTLITSSSVHGQQTLTLAQRRQHFIEAVQVYAAKDYQKAAVAFEHLRGRYPELHDYVLFFLAHTYIKLKEEQKALDLFQEFLTRYPSHPLKYDAQLNAAHLLRANEEYTAARDLYRQLLGHPDIEPGEIYYRLGQVFLALQKPAEAAFSFQQMVSLYPKHPSRKKAQQQLQTLIQKDPSLRPQWTEGDLLRQARAFFEARWYKSAIARYEAIKKQYPKSSYIEECEIRIADAYYRSGQYQKGMTTLRQLVKHDDSAIAARALYTIGSKQWNADRNTEAKTTMQQVLKNYAHTSWADNAYYVVGRIFQGEKAYQNAAKWYQELYAQHPGSSFAEESLWRAGWCYYLNKHYTEAVQAFLQGRARFPDGGYLDDTLYWLSRTQEKQKKRKEAINTYQQLIRHSPDTYYGIMAHKRLNALNITVPASSQATGGEPEMSQLLAQIQQLLPPEAYAQIRPHLDKVFELRQVNLRRYAGKEVDWIVSLIGDASDIFDTKETRDNSLVFRYFLSRLYAAAGHYLRAIQWAARLEAVLKDEENTRFSYKLDTFPYKLDTLKYPLGYWDLITTYSAANDLDPFLVAAIIRQESAYDPDALSSADAHGLMQIIPKTGKRLAQNLKLKNFSTSQLYDPELNLKLGAHYFAELLEKYSGNLYRALAAYNAGPAATSKWWPEKGTVDHEVIVENISYRETRKYVKRVLRNQYQYRRLYTHLRQN